MKSGEQSSVSSIFPNYNIQKSGWYSKMNIHKPGFPGITSTYPAAAKLLQSCPTLCNPIDGGPPGSPIPGILQARTLE